MDALDLVEVDHLGAVPDAEVRGLTGLAAESLQGWTRDRTDVEFRQHRVGQGDEAKPELNSGGSPCRRTHPCRSSVCRVRRTVDLWMSSVFASSPSRFGPAANSSMRTRTRSKL